MSSAGPAEGRVVGVGVGDLMYVRFMWQYCHTASPYTWPRLNSVLPAAMRWLRWTTNRFPLIDYASGSMAWPRGHVRCWLFTQRSTAKYCFDIFEWHKWAEWLDPWKVKYCGKQCTVRDADKSILNNKTALRGELKFVTENGNAKILCKYSKYFSHLLRK